MDRVQVSRLNVETHESLGRLEMVFGHSQLGLRALGSLRRHRCAKI
jgi:hypothetical protein